MLWFLNPTNFLLRSSMRLVRYYSNFKNVLPCIHFLSLVELECWLADVAFIPSSTLTAQFQPSRHYQAIPRLFLVWPEGSGVQTKQDLVYTSRGFLRVHFLSGMYYVEATFAGAPLVYLLRKIVHVSLVALNQFNNVNRK